MAAGRTGYAGKPARTEPARAGALGALALACALALALALAPAASARAEEVGGAGDDSFDLNLAMEVTPAADPDAEARSVVLHVGNDAGEHVAGAAVAFELQGAYGAEAASAPAAASARAAAPMAPSGAATTGDDGIVVLEGMVPGCDYRLAVEADGHERFEDVRTCEGSDGERWEVVLAKSDDGPGDGSGGSGGSGGGSGSGDGGAAGSGEVKPLPKPLPPWQGGSWGSWLLAVTGDPATPWALAVAAVVLAALAAAALARRKARADAA